MAENELAGHLNWRERLSTMPVPLCISSDSFLSTCLETLTNGFRIPVEDGVLLFEHKSLSSVCALADMVKSARFGNHVYFNENLHVNTTNICVLACRFCAFRKGPRHPEAYALSVEEFIHRIEPFSDRIDEVHSVGGLHPEWTIEHYTDLFRGVRKQYPHIHLKALTAVEIRHIANRSGLSVRATLKALSDSGLDSLPGGGAEILVDSVRDRICRGKESSNEYLQIHGIAHSLGIQTNCTMLFGTVETSVQRVIHMDKLRNQQDLSGGFQCFVPYPFLADMSRIPEAQLATSTEVIRVIAVSRLMLDNIPHIKAYRMNIGDHTAAMSLKAGADDIDGTVGHEEIMQEAGSSTKLDTSTDELARLIEQTESIPVKRNSIYSVFSIFKGDDHGDVRTLPMASRA